VSRLNFTIEKNICIFFLLPRNLAVNGGNGGVKNKALKNGSI
jgi:hypothetical protein